MASPGASARYPVVVGYDGSSPSEAALQWGSRVAECRGLGLVVVHAAERMTYAQDAGSGVWKAEDVVADAREVAGHGRDTVLEKFPDLGVEAVGSLSSAQMALGELSTHASMVVLGSHGRSREGTLLLGSTAYAIAGYARCPVVIVRDGASELPGPDRPVVAGVDVSGSSDRAVDAAVAMAREWSAPLLLATAWLPAPPHQHNRGPRGYDSAEDASQAYEGRAQQANQEALERVRVAHRSLDVHGTVVEADPVEGLIQAAERGALLVLGARVHGLAGAVLGSTSLGVLHEATSPIMIVD
ncbi:MAG: universal stress protein [Ornithinimicrobium sp.]